MPKICVVYLKYRLAVANLYSHEITKTKIHKKCYFLSRGGIIKCCSLHYVLSSIFIGGFLGVKTPSIFFLEHFPLLKLHNIMLTK
jgi:hypothetical protein